MGRKMPDPYRFTVYVGVYRVRIRVFVGGSLESAHVAMGKEWKVPVHFDRGDRGEPGANSFWKTDHSTAALWIGDHAWRDIGPSLAHEAVHLANFIMRRIGWAPDLENDEPQAYLVEHIVGHALREIHEHEARRGMRRKKARR